MDELKSVGLDVPQATELVYELKRAGWDLPDEIITEQECVDAIASYLKA